MKDITVMDQCTVRTETIVDEEDLIKLRKEMANLVSIFKENTDAIGKIQDELQEMPGGYRNSQDIKHLKGRIEKLENGNITSIGCKLAATMKKVDALEDIAKVLSKALDEERELRDRETAGLRQWLSVEEGLHTALNRRVGEHIATCNSKSKCTEPVIPCRERLEKVESDLKAIRGEMRHTDDDLINRMDGLEKKYLVGCDNARYSGCFVRINKLEECCRNTVAAGKDVEKHLNENLVLLGLHSDRLDDHARAITALQKQAARGQKFMDKLHEI
mgnify:CR=1 FL=1